MKFFGLLLIFSFYLSFNWVNGKTYIIEVPEEGDNNGADYLDTPSIDETKKDSKWKSGGQNWKDGDKSKWEGKVKKWGNNNKWSEKGNKKWNSSSNWKSIYDEWKSKKESKDRK